MTIRYMGGEWEVFLGDDGTLDTVVRVERVRTREERQFRYDQEYAAEWRKPTGEMTRKGLRELGKESIEQWLETEEDET